MNLSFRKVGRGPAWERWLIIEDQRGDAGMAGEVLINYSDIGAYSDLECDVFFNRDLGESEAEEVMDAVSMILSGRGHITIFTAQEVMCRGFSTLEEDEEEIQD